MHVYSCIGPPRRLRSRRTRIPDVREAIDRNREAQPAQRWVRRREKYELLLTGVRSWHGGYPLPLPSFVSLARNLQLPCSLARTVAASGPVTTWLPVDRQSCQKLPERCQTIKPSLLAHWKRSVINLASDPRTPHCRLCFDSVSTSDLRNYVANLLRVSSSG